MTIPVPGALLSEILRHLFGLEGLSIEAYLAVTVAVIGLGALAMVATPELVNPIGQVLTLRPGQVALWVPLSIIAFSLAFGIFVMSIVGIPVALILALIVPCIAFYGYLGAGLAIGHRIAGMLETTVPGVGAVVLGLMVMRLLRLIPFLGGILHGVVALAGLAAGTLVLIEYVRSWWRRRLPDDVQFAGEDTIEWYAPDDPRAQ